MTLKLCNGIIVLEGIAMLHDTDAVFTIIESAHEAKVGASNGTKTVLRYR